jgi:hypothetical protein
VVVGFCHEQPAISAVARSAALNTARVPGRPILIEARTRAPGGNIKPYRIAILEKKNLAIPLRGARRARRF